MEFFLLGLAIGVVATLFHYKGREKILRECAEQEKSTLERLVRQQTIAERKLQEGTDKEAEIKAWKKGHVRDPDNQYRFISNVELHNVNPVNTEAYFKVFKPVSELLAEKSRHYYLWPEVALGAFIRTPFEDRDETSVRKAFQSFNSKRADFLIANWCGEPVLVVEYHGSGHYLGKDTEKRDGVKRLALKKAGIGLIEVGEDTPNKLYLAEISRKLAKAEPLGCKKQREREDEIERMLAEGSYFEDVDVYEDSVITGT